MQKLGRRFPQITREKVDVVKSSSTLLCNYGKDGDPQIGPNIFEACPEFFCPLVLLHKITPSL